MCIRRPASASHTGTGLFLTTSPGDSENSRTMSSSGQCHILVVYGTQGHLPNLPGYCYGTMQPCRPGGLHVLGLDWAVSTPASLFEGLQDVQTQPGVDRAICQPQPSRKRWENNEMSLGHLCHLKYHSGLSGKGPASSALDTLQL